MEESELLKKRLEKIESLKDDGIPLYPNTFRYKDTAAALLARFENKDNDVLTEIDETFTIAGRLMAVRDFGKAAFIKVQDRTGSLQGYVNHVILGDEDFGLFRRLDIGDIVAMSGRIFRTRTEELTIEVSGIAASVQGDPSVAGEVARPDGCGNALSSASPGSDFQRPIKRSLSAPEPDYPVYSSFHGKTGFHGSRNADDAAQGGRRHGQALQDVPQCPGDGFLPAHRPGVVPEKTDHGRHGTGFRNQPEFPERGHFHLP